MVYLADVSFKVDNQEFLLLYCGIMENLKNLKQNYLKISDTMSSPSFSYKFLTREKKKKLQLITVKNFLSLQ